MGFEPTEIARRDMPIPAGDLVNLRGFRTHGEGTDPRSRSPQGIVSKAVGFEPTEKRTTRIPIPAGDLVNSRGFRTHGNRTGTASRSPQGILSIAVGSEPTEIRRGTPIPAGDLVNCRRFLTHINGNARTLILAVDAVNGRGFGTAHKIPCGIGNRSVSNLRTLPHPAAQNLEAGSAPGCWPGFSERSCGSLSEAAPYHRAPSNRPSRS